MRYNITMPYIENNVIIFNKHECFCPKATLECGQVFRYRQNGGGGWQVYSGNKGAQITADGGEHRIHSDDPQYFWRYFDCDTDYNALLNGVKHLPGMAEATKIRGIRLLKQQPYETIISFIISANNHIPRIKGIIDAIGPSCYEAGREDAGFYTSRGAGYRAPYLASTTALIRSRGGVEYLETLRGLPTPLLVKALQEFPGVGPKVADCIALFAYAKGDVFPVDTWVKKIYADLFGGGDPSRQNDPPKLIRQTLLAAYGEYAGICQQYLFHSRRAAGGIAYLT